MFHLFQTNKTINIFFYLELYLMYNILGLHNNNNKIGT